MTHHCKNRELTVAMTAAYDLDAEHVSFVTGSGKTTNKVESIVEDARERREQEAVDHSGGAFEGATRDADAAVFGSEEEDADAGDDADAEEDDVLTDDESESVEEQAAAAEADDDQSGLDEFFWFPDVRPPAEPPTPGTATCLRTHSIVVVAERTSRM